LLAFHLCFQYEKNNNGTVFVYLTNVPDHELLVENSGVELCFNPQKFTLPKPLKSNVTTQISQNGAIPLAANGSKTFGALEAGFTALDHAPVECYGHAEATGTWHYHNEVGCKVATTDELVGWAWDGFPIYGAINGTKDDADAALDECNGRDFDDEYGYRYHIRSLEQVHESLTNELVNNVANLKYVLGSYRGAELNVPGPDDDNAAVGSQICSSEDGVETAATPESSITTGPSSAPLSESRKSCFPADPNNLA
jgi:YHYH protein